VPARGARRRRPLPAAPARALPPAVASVDRSPCAAIGLQALGFAGAAWRYWASVFPILRGEVARLAVSAGRIPDIGLRHDALAALRKRSNLEGAAAFAASVPASRRAVVVRACVSFQAAYDYLDVVAERPHADPVANALALNTALVEALRLPVGAPEVYALHGAADDGGYLAGVLEGCRCALADLPSWPICAPAARRAAARAARFQTLNCAPARVGWQAMARCAAGLCPPDSGLAWWEGAAATGSTLDVHALIAAAASPGLTSGEVGAIECAYFPWIGALHSLLDQLVDVGEDERAGLANLTSCYEDPEQLARGLGRLAARARHSARRLAADGLGDGHELLLGAMAASYLSLPHARTAYALPARGAVLAELGVLSRLAIAVFAVRRHAGSG
jgi:tetraprenyl-beta-curcumene synthase